VFSSKNGFKQGEALSTFLFRFAIECVIRRVQVNQDGLNLYGTHQRRVYADDFNTLGGRVHNVNKKNRTFISSQLGDWTRSKC
jgi:hypothetical protein